MNFINLINERINVDGSQIIQSKVTASKENWHLVNTDDLNDGINRKGKKISNDLHYSAKGYKILGQRFAQTCIEAISKAKQP